MKAVALAVLALWLTALAPAASGASSEHTTPTDKRLYEKISSLQMKAILTKAGYKNVEIDGDDDLQITMHDYKVWLFVKGNQQRNIQFRFTVRSSPTLEVINGWNRDKSYTKAYLNKDNNAVLEMDLELSGGITEERIRDGVATFSNGLAEFLKVLGS